MNGFFSEAFLSGIWMKRFWVLAYMAALFSLAATIGRLYLPSESLHKQVDTAFNYFRPYPLDRAFAITDAPASEAPKAAGTINLLTAIKVKGIYAEGNGNGFVVAEEGKNIIFINKGESFKGYTLDRVESRRALFSKAGKPYELRLEETTPAAKVVAAPRAQTAPIDTPQTIQAVPKSEIDRYRKDARLIWDNIGINPVTENGQFKEFRVTFVAKGSVFEQLGLQAGDVLKTANGIELDGYAAALRLYSEIDKMEAFRLTIVRNNQIKELDYEIR